VEAFFLVIIEIISDIILILTFTNEEAAVEEMGILMKKFV
jgi:hypothetical protein